MELAERRAPSAPPAVRDGAFHAFFVFDAADTIDLARLASVAGEGVSRAPLQLRPEASSGFIEFETQPIVARMPSSPEGIAVRAKIFDYGVVSIRLSLPFSGSWAAFAAFTRRLRSDDELARMARATLDRVLVEIAAALDEPHEPLVEDYFVFEVESFVAPVGGAHLLAECGDALASLVLCEERRVTPTESIEALRVNFAYFDDDLAIVQWDTAFVFDRRDGAAATLDILEFANTQLVELRTYDKRPRRRTRYDLRARPQTPNAPLRTQTSPRCRRPFALSDRRHRRTHRPLIERAQDHRRRLLRPPLPRRRRTPRPQGLAENRSIRKSKRSTRCTASSRTKRKRRAANSSRSS